MLNQINDMEINPNKTTGQWVLCNMKPTGIFWNLIV